MVGKFSVNFDNVRKDGFHTHTKELGLVIGAESCGAESCGTESCGAEKLRRSKLWC